MVPGGGLPDVRGYKHLASSGTPIHPIVYLDFSARVSHRRECPTDTCRQFRFRESRQ